MRRTSLVVVFGAVSSLAFIEAFLKLETPSPTTILQTIGGAPPVQTQIQTQSQSATQAQTQSGTQTQTQTQTSTSGLQAPAGYIYVAPASALAGKTSAYFNHPTGGSSILVDFGGQWRAFSALCTHAGCVVNFTGSQIYCPCHAGYFSPSDGSVQSGPPPTPLAEYGIVVQGGSLYVSQSRIN